MKKVYFAFFRGKSITSKIIKFFTRSEYSHVGYCFNENNFNDMIEVWPTNNNILGFFKQKWRYNKISNHSKGTEIEIYSINVTIDQYIKIQDYFKYLANNNIGYNWFGVIGFVLPFWKKGSKNGYFCSEGCAEALIYAGVIKPDIQAWKYSPDEFLELLHVLNAELTTKIKL